MFLRGFRGPFFLQIRRLLASVFPHGACGALKAQEAERNSLKCVPGAALPLWPAGFLKQKLSTKNSEGGKSGKITTTKNEPREATTENIKTKKITQTDMLETGLWGFCSKKIARSKASKKHSTACGLRENGAAKWPSSWAPGASYRACSSNTAFPRKLFLTKTLR